MMIGRRRFALAGLLASAAMATPAASNASLSASDRAAFAARALALRDEAIRRGDQPYGAVVVRNGIIVGEGVSAVITANDPDAHAERLALRDAQRRLDTAELAGCLLFGSSRACSLCEAAAFRVRIERMYFGAEGSDGGAPRGNGVRL